MLIITWLQTSCFPLFDIPKKEESTTWSTSVSNEHFPFVRHAYSTKSHSEGPGIALMYTALRSRIFVANKFNSGQRFFPSLSGLGI